MKSRFWLLVFVFMLAVAGCSSKPAVSMDGNGSSKEKPAGNHEEQTEQEDAKKTDLSLLDYFLPDGSSAHYKGEGNEYAELDITVNYPAEDYIVIHENNGGSFIEKVYKLEGDEIQVLKEEHVDLEANVPTKEELEQLTPMRVYLKGPIETGTTFDDWAIVKTNGSVETPYQAFEDVVVMEQKGKDIVNRIYLVKGFGEVKRESIMTSNEGFVVTSTLETVTKPE